ncbi:MAG TPA: cupin domain-containing protein [Burkholderiales bacterium]|nr:cupin domain-containing protein [Burkholderiales bacterium]
MPYFRFDEMKSHHLNPHLSTTQGPVIEAQTMYFRCVTKQAGQQSKLHYHPNEFMAFLLEGEFDSVVGDEQHRVKPGTLVHIPSNAQHSFCAGPSGIRYLYLKDRTWTLIGAAADEALPDTARSATEVARDIAAGKYPGREKAPEKSQAITSGLGNCHYVMCNGFDGEKPSGHHEQWVNGMNLSWAYVQSPAGNEIAEGSAAHELLAYVISGKLDTQVGNDQHNAVEGDVIHVPRGVGYRWTVSGQGPARYALARSTTRLEQQVAQNGAADNWRG